MKPPQVLHTFREGGGSRPRVTLIVRDDGTAVCKDFNYCNRRFAMLFGGVLVRRERAALQQLAGLRGIPALLGIHGVRVLLLEHLGGTPIGKCHGEYDWPLFCARLQKLIADMHERGIAHGDLRSLNNILIDENSYVAVVDFSSSYILCTPWNPVSTWIFRKVSEVDLSAVVKLKLRLAPDSLSAEERHKLRQRSLLAPLARGLRGVARAVVRLLIATSRARE